MNRKIVIIGIVGLVLLFFAFVFLTPFAPSIKNTLLNRFNRITGGSRIEIDLESPNLEWKDKAKLQTIFGELLTEAKNNPSNNFDKRINRVVISLTDDPQSQVITYYGTASQGIHQASGSYTFDNDTLHLTVYIKVPADTAPILTDALLTEKIVTLFMLAAPPSIGAGRNIDKKDWTIYRYFDDLSEQYFSVKNKDVSTGNFPIHLAN